MLKYGQRMRDPLCDTLEPGLSYVGYHDPISGVPVGPTFTLLIGGSLIYNPQGKFPGDIFFYVLTDNSEIQDQVRGTSINDV